jgi:hypothetical protein
LRQSLIGNDDWRYNLHSMNQGKDKSHKRIIPLLFILTLCGWICGFCDSDQAWLVNSATFKVSPTVSLKLTQESRHLDITYAHPYLMSLHGGIVFNLAKNFYFATIYKRAHVEYQETIYNEDRVILEGGWKTEIAENLIFDLRFRTEIREFDAESPEDHLRFRLRLRLKTDFNIGELKLKPFIAVETFGKSKINTVQRSRLYIGTNFPLSDHVEFVLSYMWLATRHDESIHILFSGFELKF